MRARQLLRRRPRGTRRARASCPAAAGSGRAPRRSASQWSSRSKAMPVAVAGQEPARLERHRPRRAGTGGSERSRRRARAARSGSAAARSACVGQLRSHARRDPRPSPLPGFPRSWKSVASRTRSGAPASAAACTTAKMCSSTVIPWSRRVRSRTRSPARTPAAARRGRPCRAPAEAPCAGSRPSRSFESSPIPSRRARRRSAPRRRSHELPRARSSARASHSSGSRSSCETNRRPRTIRSGSSAKLRSRNGAQHATRRDRRDRP